MWVRDVLQHEAGKLDGVGGVLNARKTREELLAALATLDAEMSRLYLDQI